MNSIYDNDEKLSLALERARMRVELKGIGTQSERLIHITLKYYLEPDENAHEVKVGQYTADVFRKETGEILEIQTRAFERLREKLDYFLPMYPVTVVFPLVVHKDLVWVDPESGETTKKRRSPRKGLLSDILPELYRLGEEGLFRDNLRFLVIPMDVEEYRLLDGWSKDKKHGSHRMERMPIRVYEAVLLKSKEDFEQFLPQSLPEPFTRQDLMKALKLQGRKGSSAITVLERAEIIKRIGTEGRRILYESNCPQR